MRLWHVLAFLLGLTMIGYGLSGCRPTSWPPPGAPGAAGSDAGTAADAGPSPVCRTKALKLAPRTAPKASTPRIVGGQPSFWPWAVALETGTGFQFCGGTLIAPRWVLTAGHCEVRPGEYAVIGRYDLRSYDGEVIRVADVLTHADYVSAEQGNDVALLYLENPSTQEPRPLGIAEPGEYAMVVGWGLTSEYAFSTSPDQRDTQVPVLARSTCEAAYPGLPATAICAGFPEGGRDTCQGDSGGGMFVQRDGWAVVGITSFGDGCARPGKPGVYTSAEAVRPWIEACVR